MVKPAIFAVAHPAWGDLPEPELRLETALLAFLHPSPVGAPPTDSPVLALRLGAQPEAQLCQAVDPAPAVGGE